MVKKTCLMPRFLILIDLQKVLTFTTKDTKSTKERIFYNFDFVLFVSFVVICKHGFRMTFY